MARAEGLPVPAGWIAAAVAAIGIGAGVLYGVPLGVLCLAGGVLVAVVLLIWASVQSLTGSTPLSLEEAISLGAPSKEEERKQSVLRALKDLEYERSVGKISEADYQELSSRYRAEAKALLQMLDHDLEPFRKRVLDEVERRALPTNPEKGPVRKKKRAKPRKEETTPPASSEADTAEAEVATAGPADAASGSEALGDEPVGRVECPTCGARNEGDARFCKGCGGKLGEAAS